jgi:Transposase DDE domain
MSKSQAACRRLRRHLHFDALIQLARDRFDKVPDDRRCPEFSLADALMSGLALFSLKDPSLLAFQRRAGDHNLHSIFGLKHIPSDTQMRSILDEVKPDFRRPLFKDLFRVVQRGKVLEDYAYLDGCYLIALDGVEYFNSSKIHCDHCMTRHHRNGDMSYYHQMLGAVLIHPDFREVIPLAPEPIQRGDGQQKNDCERNAARRWLKQFRQDHPHLPVIITEDGLSSNGPHIRDLQESNCHFILGVKQPDHTHLFEQVMQQMESGKAETLEVIDPATGIRHCFQFVNEVRLNEANQDIPVNVLHYLQIDSDGQHHEFCWVTDLHLTAANVYAVMRGGRARWRIENETFNTLKNQGYHFEHNFGHGYKNLSVVLASLMMAAFLIDQIQQRCNQLFQAAHEKAGPKSALWEAIRSLFYSFEVVSMAQIYEAVAFGHERPKLQPLQEQTQAAVQAVNSS